MKNNRLFLLAFFLMAILSCEDEKASFLDCITSTEGDQTGWFEDLTSNLESNGEWYIVAGIYDSQTVFMPRNCCLTCLWIASVYNCQGVQIGTMGSGDGQIDPEDIQDGGIVWRAPDFRCDL